MDCQDLDHQIPSRETTSLFCQVAMFHTCYEGARATAREMSTDLLASAMYMGLWTGRLWKAKTLLDLRIYGWNEHLMRSESDVFPCGARQVSQSPYQESGTHGNRQGGSDSLATDDQAMPRTCVGLSGCHSVHEKPPTSHIIRKKSLSPVARGNTRSNIHSQQLASDLRARSSRGQRFGLP